MPARHHRVTRGEDYRRIVRNGNRVGGAFCITYAVSRALPDEQDPMLKRQDPARFGYIVSKAVGNAVTRNLVRRRMKSITDAMLQDGMTGFDIVFRALPAAAAATYSELEQGMQKAVSRLSDRKQQHAP